MVREGIGCTHADVLECGEVLAKLSLPSSDVWLCLLYSGLSYCCDSNEYCAAKPDSFLLL